MVINYTKIGNIYTLTKIKICCKEMGQYFICKNRPRYCLDESELVVRFIDLMNGNEIDYCPDCGAEIVFTQV